jgi:hypothetical protein
LEAEVDAAFDCKPESCRATRSEEEGNEETDE